MTIAGVRFSRPMRIDPSMPLHLARAYGVSRAGFNPVPPVTPVQRKAMPQQDASNATPANAARLVAARVPGGIDFTAGDAQPTPTQSLAMYRHPADKNAAAVSVQAGRAIDVRG